MRDILSSKDKRLIHIIEILNRNKWISLTDLSEKLACSEKTTRNDLKTLTTQYQDVIIESSSTLGYHLVNDNESNENLSDDIIGNTLIAQILLILLKDSTLKLTELESLLFVTPNSVRAAISPFNDYFKESSNMEIQSRPFQLVGDETNITTFYLVNLMQSYFKGKARYHDEFYFLEQLIAHIFSENQAFAAQFSDDRYTLNLLFFVRIYREKNKHHVPSNDTHLSQSYSFIENKYVRDEFFNVFKTSLTDDLINTLVSYALFEPFTTSYLQMTYLLPNTAESQRLHATVTHLLNTIAGKLQIEGLSSEVLADMMKPKQHGSTTNRFNYQLNEYCQQLLTYEFYELLNLTNISEFQPLYELYMLIELSAVALSNWQALYDKLASIELTMTIGLHLVSSAAYRTMYTEFFTHNTNSHIIYSDISSLRTAPDCDLILTNLVESPYPNIQTITLANLPTATHLKKINGVYQEFKLNKYLNYLPTQP